MTAHRLRLAALPTLAVAASLLTGCVPEPAPTTNPSAGAPSSPASPSATPSTAPSATPADEGEPLAIGCDELVTAEQMYDYNPNFALLDDWEPAAGTPAAQAVAAGGVACRWVNLSSDTTIDVAAARPGGTRLAAWREDAAAGERVDAFPGGGYFVTLDGVNTAVAFPSDAWVAVASRFFVAAEDAQPLVAAAAGAVD